MLYINNADSSYSEQRVTLGSSVYTLKLKYNVRNKGWYLGILDSSGTEELLTGLKLVPNQCLTSRYIIDGFEGGLYCLRVKNDFTSLDRYNLGRSKVYRLAWLSDDEVSGLGVEDYVQLP